MVSMPVTSAAATGGGSMSDPIANHARPIAATQAARQAPDAADDTAEIIAWLESPAGEAWSLNHHALLKHSLAFTSADGQDWVTTFASVKEDNSDTWAWTAQQDAWFWTPDAIMVYEKKGIICFDLPALDPGELLPSHP
jgi:hypothetical protein